MIFIKKKGHDNTVRSITSDDKTKCIGVVGTVGDLLKEHLLTYCDYGPNVWCFIPKSNAYQAMFENSREDVTKHLRGI